ncbi:DUF6942 family protein [Photobacterium frigidiphilum]
MSDCGVYRKYSSHDEHRVIVCPYFDNRQLSNIKI